MARIPPWMVGVKEAQRERERAEKAITYYGVFVHSSGEHGGYVVRDGRKRDDGSYYFPTPYSDQTPKYISHSRKLAERKADQLNGFD